MLSWHKILTGRWICWQFSTLFIKTKSHSFKLTCQWLRFYSFNKNLYHTVTHSIQAHSKHPNRTHATYTHIVPKQIIPLSPSTECVTFNIYIALCTINRCSSEVWIMKMFTVLAHICTCNVVTWPSPCNFKLRMWLKDEAKLQLVIWFSKNCHNF